MTPVGEFRFCCCLAEGDDQLPPEANATGAAGKAKRCDGGDADLVLDDMRKCCEILDARCPLPSSVPAISVVALGGDREAWTFCKVCVEGRGSPATLLTAGSRYVSGTETFPPALDGRKR